MSTPSPDHTALDACLRELDHLRISQDTPNQIVQQTPQMGHAQAATQQQEAIMQNQPDLGLPPQPGSSGQDGPMAGGLPNLPPLPPQLQQLFNNPEVMKLSAEELERRGLSQDIIQTMMIYRQAWIAKTIQNRREQELLLQQRQVQAQQAQQAAQRAALPPQPSAPQLSATIAGLNVSPEQLSNAQEKIRAAIGLFHNKRDYSSINLSHEQGILLEQSIQQTQSLLKQVAQNLVAFVVLAPNDERELNQVARTLVTLSDQAQILQRQPPEKRFIFGLGDLNQYRNHLTTFLMRVKGLQSQAMSQREA